MAKKKLKKKVAIKKIAKPKKKSVAPAFVKTTAGKKKKVLVKKKGEAKKKPKRKRRRIRLEPKRTNFIRSLMITELWKGEELTELELRVAVRRLCSTAYHQFFDNYFDFVFSKLKKEKLIDEIVVKRIRKLRLVERLGK